jgi:uncharacterized OsmC-like protein/alpha/beta superfamily hydrolase
VSARIERITFSGADGVERSACLDLPARPPVAHAVLADRFADEPEHGAAARIATALTSAGFAVLRLDAASPAGADVVDSPTGADVVAAADWLRRERRAPQLLIGHSLGGAAVLAAVDAIPEVRALATIGAPSSAAALDAVATCRRSLLILHSPIDNTVGVEQAADLFVAARHPKSFVSLDGADHLLSSPADADYAASTIAAFAARYVHDESGSRPAPDASAQVVVAETGQGSFLNHVVVGRHALLADEPESVGGFDAGPSPYDFIGAALGSCTSMTLRMYADRKGFALDHVAVEVSHDKVHGHDCAECVDMELLFDRSGRIDRFRRVIRLEGELDDEQRNRLLEIADRCPVHRTLSSNSVITTTLA